MEGGEDSKANMQRACGKKYVLSFIRCTNSRFRGVFTINFVVSKVERAVD